jgi:hypothetical protein
MKFLGAFLALFSPAAVFADGEPPEPLRAGPGSQRQQNLQADAEDLSRLQDLAMVRRFVRAGLLQPVPFQTQSYYLHGVPGSYRYLRPWAKLFLERLSRQFRTRFGARLRVTSLVRTVSYQERLRGRNGNAAAAYGAGRSTHLTGASLDISKRFMDPAQLHWMRSVLHSLHGAGHVFAVEEFAQPAFHIMVHKSYLDYVRQRTTRASGMLMLAPAAAGG